LLVLTAPAAENPVNTTAKMRKISLENFDLWVERELDKKSLLDTRRNLLNVRREVGSHFASYPDMRFNVLLVDAETFRQYSKASSHVAGLFDGDIHLPLQASGYREAQTKAILWHEYTHALVWWLSKGQCPIWLNEGLGSYEEEQIRPKRKAQLGSVIDETGRLRLTIERLEAIFARPKNVDIEELMRAYNTAYVIVDYLFDRYQTATIRNFVESFADGGAFDQNLSRYFHKTRQELELEVERHIQRKI
jgi:hypothetical protein